jgi:hypothetical protein
MKITIDLALLTHQYFKQLVERSDYDSIEDVADDCFIDGLAKLYARETANTSTSYDQT